ncbi:MAG: zf-HC2 domain-containing protein [Deltaproteobacteria bacterium]|nr:zf-HC2 domain-containing protein [Deltaproteobacteria bacterium]
MSGAADWTHLSEAQVRALVEGALSDAEAEVLALHLDECPRCAARAAAADPLRPALLAAPDAAPPADLLAALISQSAALCANPEAVEVAAAPLVGPGPARGLAAPGTSGRGSLPAAPLTSALGPTRSASSKAGGRPWAPLAAAAALGLAGAFALRSTGELEQLLHVILVSGVAAVAIARAAAGSLSESVWVMLVELPVVGGAAWWWLRKGPPSSALRRS